LLKLLSHCLRRNSASILRRYLSATLSASENHWRGGVIDRHNLSRCAELNPRVYVSLRFSFQRPKPRPRANPGGNKLALSSAPRKPFVSTRTRFDF
jgi:hypothetical protein